MEWSIHEVARSAGTTSRTLRHYGEIGLLPPSRIGANGYRYYDERALVRLQRILLLRELGLGLPAIAEVLDGHRDAVAALKTHLRLLEQERARVERQIESVRTTLRKTEAGERLVADEVFDGFDSTRYRDEVIERWGRAAYDEGAQWWRSLSRHEKDDFRRRALEIAAEFGRAHAAGRRPDSDEVQALVRRHYEWVEAGWQATHGGAVHRARPDVRRGSPLREDLRPARRGDRGLRARGDDRVRGTRSVAVAGASARGRGRTRDRWR